MTRGLQVRSCLRPAPALPCPVSSLISWTGPIGHPAGGSRQAALARYGGIHHRAAPAAIRNRRTPGVSATARQPALRSTPRSQRVAAAAVLLLTSPAKAGGSRRHHGRAEQREQAVDRRQAAHEFG